MTIKMIKFGEILVSRPAGKEALAIIETYLQPSSSESIELDFTDVKVVAPSWLDEVLTPLRAKYGSRVVVQQSTNSSLNQSMRAILP